MSMSTTSTRRGEANPPTTIGHHADASQRRQHHQREAQPERQAQTSIIDMKLDQLEARSSPSSPRIATQRNDETHNAVASLESAAFLCF
jgi:hypothetical protein